MPPKSKRKIQLEQARATKLAKSSEPTEPAVSEPAASPQPSTSGVSFSEPAETELDPETPEEYEERSSMAHFASEWVESLSRDDLLSLSVFLWHVFVGILSFKLTDAAELIGRVIGRSDRTVREWRVTFNSNRGTFPDTLQGKYQRDGVLWQNENLNKRAVKYVRENTVVRGKPNLTASSFCQWVNECLLETQTLEPGFPRRVSIETARKWLLELGFTVMDHKKGTWTL